MANLHNVVVMLNAERRKLEQQASGISQALAALTNGHGNRAIHAVSTRRHLSPSARRRIAAAQRERWAKFHAAQEKPAKKSAWTPARRRAYSLRMKKNQKLLQRARKLAA